jgi:hypothetical protein
VGSADIANIVVDTYVTGGTYNAGTATFRNNFGASFNVTGFKESDLVVTGATGNDSVKLIPSQIIQVVHLLLMHYLIFV